MIPIVGKYDDVVNFKADTQLLKYKYRGRIDRWLEGLALKIEKARSRRTTDPTYHFSVAGCMKDYLDRNSMYGKYKLFCNYVKWQKYYRAIR